MRLLHFQLEHRWSSVVPDDARLKALHLRCSERGACQRVSDWLSAHGVAAQDAGNVYQVAAAVVTEQIAPLPLVVAGVDWLTDDELSFVPTLAQRWPSCTVIVYCGLPRRLPSWTGRIRTFIGSFDLDRLVQSSPNHLLVPITPAGQSCIPAMPARRSSDQAQVAAPDANPPKTEQAQLETQNASNANTAHDAKMSDKEKSLRDETDLPPPSLTPEELAALLARD
jgi:hypothetical protein